MQHKQALLGTKIRIYQTNLLIQQSIVEFGCTRFIYNHFLKLRSRYYKIYKKSISYKRLSKHLTKLRELDKYSWLWKGSRTTQTQALRNLDVAFNKFFNKKAKYPTFKSKYGIQKCRFQDVELDIEKGRVCLPKIGWVKLHLTKNIKKRLKEITSKPDSIVLSQNTYGQYFISFNTLKEIKYLPETNKTLGIDVGITHLLTLSNGEKLENHRFLKRKLKALKHSQQALARKVKGSKRRDKQKKKVVRLHLQIANARYDSYQKITTELIKNNRYIFVEDLNINGMIKNRKLSRSISDASWGLFLNMLEYKAKIYGRIFRKIGKFEPSTKTCSGCLSVNENLSLKDREWECPICHIVHDRDVNAAKNIERIGWNSYILEASGKTNIEMEEDLSNKASVEKPRDGKEMFIKTLSTEGAVGNGTGGCVN